MYVDDYPPKIAWFLSYQVQEKVRARIKELEEANDPELYIDEDFIHDEILDDVLDHDIYDIVPVLLSSLGITRQFEYLTPEECEMPRSGAIDIAEIQRIAESAGRDPACLTVDVALSRVDYNTILFVRDK